MSLSTRKLSPHASALSTFRGLVGVRRCELARLAPLFDDVHVPAGAVLAHEGRPCHELLLVVEGAATSAVRGRNVAEVGPGDVLGESAILGHDLHHATVTTRTPARVLVAGCDSCRTLRGDPLVLRLIATDLARRLARVPGGARSEARVDPAGSERWRLTG